VLVRDLWACGTTPLWRDGTFGLDVAIIAKNAENAKGARMIVECVSYALPMSDDPIEHRAKIAEARNVLGEVIARARFGGEATILVNRGKDAAVIVSPEFYEQAKRDRRVAERLREEYPVMYDEFVAEASP
jgi:prevent-host-death family protein